MKVNFFVYRKKKHVRFAFKKVLTSYPFFNKFIRFVKHESEEREVFMKITKCFIKDLCIRWSGGLNLCFFRRKNNVNVWKWSREPLQCNCGRCTWNIYKKYYIVRISLSKNDNVYLLVRKKKRRPLGVKKECFIQKTRQIVTSVFSWHTKIIKLLHDYFSIDFRLIKESSGYYFHFLLISKNKIVNSFLKK